MLDFFYRLFGVDRNYAILKSVSYDYEVDEQISEVKIVSVMFSVLSAGAVLTPHKRVHRVRTLEQKRVRRAERECARDHRDGSRHGEGARASWCLIFFM